MIVLIGFFSKQFVLYSALQNGYYFISLIAIIVSVISASYYLKIIKVLHTDHDLLNEDKEFKEFKEGAKEGVSLTAEIPIETLILKEPTEKSRLGGYLSHSSEPNLWGLDLEQSKTTLTNTHSFVISSLTLIILLFFIKPSIILNSTQLLSLCAPYEGFCCMGLGLIPLVYLTVIKFNDTSCGYSRLFKLRTLLVWIAEYKYDQWLGLPSKETIVSRNSQVDFTKSVTYKRQYSKDNILSSLNIIQWYCSSIAWWHDNGSLSRQKARRSSPTGSFKLKCEQSAKTIWTLNTTLCQLRDLTASTVLNKIEMRKRNFHSSVCIYAKGSSINPLTLESSDSNNNKPVNKVEPRKKVAKRVGVTTIVMQKLEQYKKPEQKYYNLIDIIADPYFLVACYEEIAKKKGNITPETEGITIEGLNWDWFVRTANQIKKGQLNFNPNRRLEIPKTKGKSRPLAITSHTSQTLQTSHTSHTSQTSHTSHTAHSSHRDKIVEKAFHAVLEAIFEPKFLNSSHGFRPQKSVHSALLRVYLTGHKHNWVIQGDFTQCFYQIPHEIIMKRINKYIGDPRFLEIFNKFLKARYIVHKTGDLVQSEIGTTQAGVLSPLLCNIVLHELDKYMGDTEIKFSKGKTRKINPLYPVYKSMPNKKISSSEQVEQVEKVEKVEQVEKLEQVEPVEQVEQVEKVEKVERVEKLNLLTEMRETQRSLNVKADPNYRRLEYIRYADDFIVLVSGSFKDANYIKNNIKDYIKANCGLELNQNNTVIYNILKNEWSFLGAKMKKLKIKPLLHLRRNELLPHLRWNELLPLPLPGTVPGTGTDAQKQGKQMEGQKQGKQMEPQKQGKQMEGRVKLVSGTQVGIAKLLVNAPIDKLLGILKKSGFVRQNKLGKFIPKAYTSIINLTHYEIVSFYNSKIKGICNFYYFASNRKALASIFWLLKASCALTLARKLKLKTMRKVFRKFKGNLKCPHSDIELYCPSSLKVLHEFKTSKNNKEKVLLQSGTGKLKN